MNNKQIATEYKMNSITPKKQENHKNYGTRLFCASRLSPAIVLQQAVLTTTTSTTGTMTTIAKATVTVQWSKRLHQMLFKAV